MRVALNGYFWSQPRTGSGQYLRHLWEALQTLPDMVASGRGDALDLVMLLPPDSAGDNAVSSGRRASIVQARRNVVATRSHNFGRLLWEQGGVARHAKAAQANLLHTPYLTAPLLFSTLVRKRGSLFQGLKSPSQPRQVVTAHDMIPWVLPGYSGSRFFKLYLALAAAGVKRAGAIMADSEASRQDVIRVLRVSPSKVFTVYLGTEPTQQYGAEELHELRARFSLPARYAFYLGGFDSRKNVPLLLKAWRDALQALDTSSGEKSLLAIGGAVPGAGGVFPDVMGEADALGLLGPDAPVRFLGRISETDKPLIMAAAHLFVYPSLYEGFGLDPLEAMSVGCPVVSSSGGSLSEVVGSGGLLVPPNDADALASAIIRAWHDEDLRAKLTQSGKVQASHFTWERTASQTLQVYRYAMRRRRVR